jgi:hypothetical protein
MFRRILAVGAVALVAGCGSGPTASAHQGAARAGTPVAVHLAARPARSLCVAALPNRPISGWMPATVGALRSYQYGGPVAHRPLRSAFAGLSPAHPGAWCVRRDGSRAISLWGVVGGRCPRLAIKIVGPGIRPLGLMDRPPQVP